MRSRSSECASHRSAVHQSDIGTRSGAPSQSSKASNLPPLPVIPRDIPVYDFSSKGQNSVFGAISSTAHASNCSIRVTAIFDSTDCGAAADAESVCRLGSLEDVLTRRRIVIVSCPGACASTGLGISCVAGGIYIDGTITRLHRKSSMLEASDGSRWDSSDFWTPPLAIACRPTLVWRSTPVWIKRGQFYEFLASVFMRDWAHFLISGHRQFRWSAWFFNQVFTSPDDQFWANSP